MYMLECQVILRKSRDYLAQLLNFKMWEDVLCHFKDATMLKNP